MCVYVYVCVHRCVHVCVCVHVCALKGLVWPYMYILNRDGGSMGKWGGGMVIRLKPGVKNRERDCML